MASLSNHNQTNHQLQNHKFLASMHILNHGQTWKLDEDAAILNDQSTPISKSSTFVPYQEREPRAEYNLMNNRDSEPKKTVNNTGIFSTSDLLKQTGLSRSASVARKDTTVSSIIVPSVQSEIDISPSKSDETLSTSDSLNTPDVEYIDSNDIAAIESTERKMSSKLSISDHEGAQGNVCKREIILTEMGTGEKIVDLDVDFMEPQLCATMACDIYQHLRATEAKKRPAVDFMENVQKDIKPSMRAIVIDWLVEVAEEYRLVPDTLYLTINYLDRFLSGNLMDRQRLQLLGVTCMLIASKYEEIYAPQVEEFCYITDNTYCKDEVLEMELSVLYFLKFEMTAPTVRCFLGRYIRAAQGENEAPCMHLEYLASYIAELSLLEYDMLQYAPSLVAASAIFLARFVKFPSKKPWDSTLRHYTQYQPSDLSECVKALHVLVCECPNSSLPAIREKYSQHKYKSVAKKYNCPPSIPVDYFQNCSC